MKMMRTALGAVVIIICILMTATFFACGDTKFTITFMVDDQVYETLSTAGNEEITLPNAPEKADYTFDGWYFDKDTWEEPLTVQSFLEKALTGDLTVYAKFSFKKYNVTFNANGGTLVSGQASQQVEHGSDATAPVFQKEGYSLSWDKSFEDITEDTVVTAVWTPVSYTITYNNTFSVANQNPTAYNIESNTINLSSLSGRTGYNFDGWYTAQTGGTKKTSITKGSTGNLTLYARWNPISYTVTYSNTFGANNTNPVSYTIESNEITLAALTGRTGYNFSKWQDQQGNTVTKITAGSTGNKTFTAVWTPVEYGITYNNTFGATNLNPATYTIESAEITLTALTGRNGYSFVKWQDQQGNTVTKISAGSTGAKTFTAVWDAVPYGITYNNTFDAANTNPSTYTIESNITLAGLTGREGYSFVRWEDAEGNTVTKIEEGTTGVITLTAVWQINKYTVTFESNGGGEIDSITQDYGTLITLPTPERAGYTFAGWYLDDDTFNDLFGYGTMPAFNVKVYAKWLTNAEYTITFVTNGGSDVEPITCRGGESITEPDAPDREGYTFGGWYTDNNTFQNDFQFTVMPEENTMLYAKWTVNKYTIEFDSNGGSEVASITQDFGTVVTVPDDPEKTGHSFVGWFTDKDTLVNEYTFSTMPAQNIKLYAKWDAIEYTITFHTNGGSAVASITQDFGTAITEPEEPTKEGFDFDGWYLDDETFTQAFEFTTMPAHNIELYAKWVIAKHNLNVVGGTAVDLTGETNGDTKVYIVEYNSEITLVAGPAPAGKIFVGWDWQTEGNRVETDSQFTFLMPDQDVTVWAVYDDISPESLTMTQSPYRIVYSDEMTFDLDGFEAEAIYNDGSKKKVETAMFTVIDDTLSIETTVVSVWCEVDGVTLFYDIPLTVLAASQYSDGNIIAIKAEGTVYLTEGQDTSTAGVVIRATYDNGNRLILSQDKYEVTANTLTAGVTKKCILSVYLKNDPAIFTNTAAIVRSAMEAEIATLTGTQAETVDEYTYNGMFTLTGQTTVVPAADGAEITFTFAASTMLKPDIYLRIASTSENAIRLADVISMSINDRAVTIPSVAIISALEGAEGKAVFYEISLPAVVLNIGNNTLVFAFNGQNASELLIDKVIFDVGFKGQFYSSTEEYTVAMSQSGQNAEFVNTIVKTWGTVGGKPYGHAICSDGTYLYITSTSYSDNLRALRVQKYDPATNTQVAASADTEVAAKEECAGITYFDNKIIIYFMDGRRMYVDVDQFENGCEFEEYDGFDFEGLETAVLKDVYYNATVQRFAVFSGSKIYLYGTDKQLISSFNVPTASGTAKRMTGSADYIYISYTKDGQYSPVVQIFDWNGNSKGGLVIPIAGDFLQENGLSDLTRCNIQGMAVIKGDFYAILLKFGPNNGGDNSSYVKITMPPISEELEPDLTFGEYLLACDDAEVNPVFIVAPATGVRGEINGTSGYSMGGASDGKYLYFANNTNGNANTTISKVDAFTYRKVASGASFAVPTAVSNGDNSRLFIKDGVLYCVAGNVFSIALDRFADQCQITLDEEMTALLSEDGSKVLKSAYWNNIEKRYAIMTQSGQLQILNEEGEQIGETVQLSYSDESALNYVASSIYSDDTFIYVSYKVNTQPIIPIDIYTWDGTYVKTLGIEGINSTTFTTNSYNVQSIFIHNGTLHASVCTWSGTAQYYDWIIKCDLSVFTAE